MIAEGTHVCAQCDGENEEPNSEPKGFCSDECKRVYDLEYASGAVDRSPVRDEMSGGAFLTVPDLGPPLPEYEPNDSLSLPTGNAIPAVPPTEAPKPSPAVLTERVIRLQDALSMLAMAAKRAEDEANAAGLMLDQAVSAKAAQMLADGTRLVSIGGVTYEARKSRKGASPTLVPVKVGE